VCESRQCGEIPARDRQMGQGRSAEQKGSSSPGLVAIAEILLVGIH